MPRFAANLTMMFPEWSFLDRFDAAADAGFDAVEYWFPYDYAPDALQERLARNKLEQAFFNVPPGDWAAGERGFACRADRFPELQQSVETALTYARATGVKRLHLLSGLGDRGNAEAVVAYRKAVIWTAERLAQDGLDLLLEPLNARHMPGYLLNDFNFAEGFIRQLSLPNVKLQFDIFHCQIIHGDVTVAVRRMMPIVGHVQVASVPSRHEPTTEELNDSFLFAELDRLGYRGFVGCEYVPRAGTAAGLRWLRIYKGATGARTGAPR